MITNPVRVRCDCSRSSYSTKRYVLRLYVAGDGEPFKTNTWSVTRGAANWTPANIVGGPKVGGNYWSRPDNTGHSQTNPDANGDGFIDIPLTIAAQNLDYFPLAIYTGPTPVTTTPTPTVTATPTPGVATVSGSAGAPTDPNGDGL